MALQQGKKRVADSYESKEIGVSKRVKEQAPRKDVIDFLCQKERDQPFMNLARRRRIIESLTI